MRSSIRSAIVVAMTDPEKLLRQAQTLRAEASELERQAVQLMAKARAESGLSQSRLAALMGVGQTRVSQIENSSRVTPEVAGVYYLAVQKGATHGPKQSQGAKADLEKARNSDGRNGD